MNDELAKRLQDFRKRQASTANANAAMEAEKSRRKAAAAKAAATRAATMAARAKAKREAQAAAGGGGGGGGGAGPGPGGAGATTRDSLRTARRVAGVPLAKQLKDALDALMASRAPMPAPLLAKACGHDVSPGSALAAALEGSAKVKVHVPPPGAPAPPSFSYVATHAATDKAGLVSAVAAHPDGLAEAELADAYPGAAEDAAALVADGALWSLPDPDGGATLFAREDPPLISPDPDVVAAWHADAAPPADPAAFDAALKRAGIVPAPRRLPARAVWGTGGRRRGRGGGHAAARAPRVTTNVHMPELFEAGGPNPQSIDG